MIITHRGNDFGPENSMKALKTTLDVELEGIEADVSRTSSCCSWRSVVTFVMFLRYG